MPVPQKVTDEQLKLFYDALAEHVNRDGYTFVSISHAAQAAGAAVSSAIFFARRLNKMGCIELFESFEATSRPGQRKVLVKIIMGPDDPSILRKSALAKLTPEERRALNL